MLKEIHIDWKGPYTYEEVKKMDGKTDFGIYQFYGYHAAYGADALLYIGMTEKNFASGMKNSVDHQIRFDDYSTSDKMNIYVGRLTGAKTPNKKEWLKQIKLAKNLLIFAHQPAGNSQNLNIKFYQSGELFNIHIFNWGKHKCLLPEVSGRRYARNYPQEKEFKPYISNDE